MVLDILQFKFRIISELLHQRPDPLLHQNPIVLQHTNPIILQHHEPYQFMLQVLIFFPQFSPKLDIRPDLTRSLGWTSVRSVIQLGRPF